eukprot:UN15680
MILLLDFLVVRFWLMKKGKKSSLFYITVYCFDFGSFVYFKCRRHQPTMAFHIMLQKTMNMKFDAFTWVFYAMHVTLCSYDIISCHVKVLVMDSPNGSAL